MKKITFLAVAVAVIGFYLFPVFLAQAADSTVPASTDAQGSKVAGNADLVLYLHITAYSSDVDQTDSTPFITANGTHVHDGIVATNLLPFGTRIEIPALFGTKVFFVEDRMNPKMVGRMDVWMPSRSQAVIFGSNYANVIVLGPTASSATTDNGSIAEAGN